ncbi:MULTISPECIES: cell wall metabolism sensor histidine kinase WalK [unclassified Streptomyces]|uniref:sensor histidine kinase n=1 Tax=unclassified Streptomyces TaxID=2593676 RepID=UPI00278BEBEA|nr:MULTISPECIES: ATP-binding protein [unclassified Streptomyces]
MTFRLRALGLLLLVAVVATAATAWLTLSLAAGQVRESVTAGRAEVSRITGELYAYGFAHGTWDEVPDTVRSLAEDTGQRIRVVTEDDVLLADSDALAGREPRPVSSQPPVLVDPRPELRLPAGQLDERAAVKRTVTAMGRYRVEATRAACLTGAGAVVTARKDDLGLPRVSADRAAPQCEETARTADTSAVRDQRDAAACQEREGGAGLRSCLRKVFADRTADVTPPRLQVRLGTLDEAPPALRAMPVAAVAGGVALVVTLGALLLSRTVLRPIRALTSAARGLGEGDMARRVPLSGRDEIGELGRAFNRMADSLQAAEERQRRLTGDIAHELRTPLANLRGYLEALQDGVVEPTPDLLGSLHEEALLQQRIVDDLQDLALAEAGALTYHRSTTGLGELLRGCRTTLRAQAETAGVALVAVTDTDTDTDTEVYVDADPHRLRQVVGNLVSNALRATAAGGSVNLVARRLGPDAAIEVRDTGTGMPPEDLDHVFDRFWRADAARGRDTGGSGLGLAIVHQIVTDHGGSVEVASTVGAGTVFTVRLPAVGAPPGDVGPSPG